MTSTIYTIFVVISLYNNTYLIILIPKCKNENGINSRNTLNPLRRNGFSHTIFKIENGMGFHRNVESPCHVSVSEDFPSPRIWYEKW